MLILTHERQITEICNLAVPLREVLRDTVETYHRLRAERGYRFNSLRVTSIYRTSLEDGRLGGSGIHSTIPHRAIDLGMTWEWVGIVGGVINRRWVYDPSRPHLRVIVTKEHGTGAHCHIQVHSNTILRSEMQMGDMV